MLYLQAAVAPAFEPLLAGHFRLAAPPRIFCTGRLLHGLRRGSSTLVPHSRLLLSTVDLRFTSSLWCSFSTTWTRAWQQGCGVQAL